MAEAALDYDQLLDQPPLEIPAGGIANFITATTGSWADEDDIPRNGIAEVKKVANKLAEYGRHEDEYMVHAAEGETVIPMAVFRENPRLKEKLFEQMRMMGIDPERYVVGNELNSINPVTGQPEFFLKKLWRGVKKVFKKVIHVVLPVVLNTMFPGMGLIASSALSSGVITLTQGGSFGDALKSAAMGGATAGVLKGIQGGIQGARSGEGFGAGFREGVAGGLPGKMRQRMYQRQLAAQGKDVSEFFPEAKDIPVEDGLAREGSPKPLPGSPDPSQTVFDGPFDGPYDDDAYKQQLFTEARPPYVEETLPGGGKTRIYDQGFHDRVQEYKADQAAALSQPGSSQPVTSPAAAGVDSLRPRRFGEAFKDMFVNTGPGDKGFFEAAGEAFFPRAPGYEKLSQAMFNKPLSQLNTQQISALKIQAADMTPGMMRKFAPLLGASMAIDAFQKDDEIEVDMNPWGGQTGQELFEANPGKYSVDFNLPTYGRAHGGSIDAMQFPPRIGAISGPGTETSDDVPAMLSDGEFVMTAEAVRGAGNGNRQAGMNNMYNLMRNFERVA